MVPSGSGHDYAGQTRCRLARLPPNILLAMHAIWPSFLGLSNRYLDIRFQKMMIHPSEFGHDKADTPDVKQHTDAERRVAKAILERKDQKYITKAKDQKLNKIQREAKGEGKEIMISRLATITDEKREGSLPTAGGGSRNKCRV